MHVTLEGTLLRDLVAGLLLQPTCRSETPYAPGDFRLLLAARDAGLTVEIPREALLFALSLGL